MRFPVSTGLGSLIFGRLLEKGSRYDYWWTGGQASSAWMPEEFRPGLWARPKTQETDAEFESEPNLVVGVVEALLVGTKEHDFVL